jgi:hypothetical protein
MVSDREGKRKQTNQIKLLLHFAFLYQQQQGWCRTSSVMVTCNMERAVDHLRKQTKRSTCTNSKNALVVDLDS